MNELLVKCPFCDGETPPEVCKLGNGYSKVMCSWCGASGGTRENEAQAIEDWNNRQQDDKDAHIRSLEHDNRVMREALEVLLDQVDYMVGNCNQTEMVGAVLSKSVIAAARTALSSLLVKDGE